jgi:hypothetical protein
MNTEEKKERQAGLQRKLAAWTERAAVARTQNQPEVETVAHAVAAAYKQMMESNGAEPEALVKANTLRKRIESAEQHRTMAAEHGLNDEAIDVTYEIQQLEKELVELIERWKQNT